MSELHPERLPLPLPRQAAARPEHPALWVRGRSVTYGRLHAQADRLARQLAALGIGPGDRIAALLPDGLRYALLLHAAARLEAVIVPLNRRLSSEELAWQIEHADPGLVVVECAWRERLASVERPIRHLSAPLLDPRTHADGGESGGPWDGGAELAGLKGVAPDPVVRLHEHVDANTAQTIIYTSGTSGRPKGAVLSYGNHLWNALGSSLRLGIDADDRWLVPLPLFHVGGLAVLLRSALAGTTAVLPGGFESKSVAASLARDRITLVSMVPTLLSRVLDVWGGAPAPTGLRAVLLGGGPIAPALLERALAAGFPVAPTYGLTEAASQVATARPLERMPDAGIAAEPLAFTELVIRDAQHRALAPGEAGEIWLRGPSVMTGYWRDEAATAEAKVGGWLRTGDFGWLDARGQLHVDGRREDLIVSGGENIYPAEVEAALRQHPTIAECAVLGEQDAEWGQRVVAVLVPVTSRDLPAPEALATFLRPRLAGFKHPRRYVVREALPRGASGKLKRAELRSMLDLTD